MKKSNVETVDRNIGKWTWRFADNGWGDWVCPFCNWTWNADVHVYIGFNFCPECGARLSGGHVPKKEG